MDKGDLKKEVEEKIIEDLAMERAKKQVQQHNRILKGFFVFVILLVVIFVAWSLVSYNNSKFEYKGVEFSIVDEIAPYRVQIPLASSGITGAATGEGNDAYFYLRKDPRSLEYIPFYGAIDFRRNLVMNSTGDIKCEGMGIVGTYNLANLYRLLGTTVATDPNATCDNEARFMFVQIEEGNETKIEKIGTACYKLTFKDCEVLEVTERFFVETLSQANSIINK
ncbi:MAG: hypothetical protein KKB31_04000 [Nanoarchaeota archaeon]|nr:hypothetical protein [Nanoarchaeota archaeon]